MKAILTINYEKFLISDLKTANRISELMQGAKRVEFITHKDYKVDSEPVLTAVKTVLDSNLKTPHVRAKKAEKEAV